MTTRRAVLRTILGLEEQSSQPSTDDRLLLQPADGGDARKIAPQYLWPRGFSAANGADVALGTTPAEYLRLTFSSPVAGGAFVSVNYNASAWYYYPVGNSDQKNVVAVVSIYPLYQAVNQVITGHNLRLNQTPVNPIAGAVQQTGSWSGIMPVAAGSNVITLEAWHQNCEQAHMYIAYITAILLAP